MFRRLQPYQQEPFHDNAAITRAIAQAHGGSVSVVSDDTGTLFELVLPSTSAR